MSSNNNITLKEIQIDTKNEKRHYLIGKCPDNRPTSFEIKYSDKWIREDGRHFYKTLRKYNLDPPLDKHGDKKKMELALNSIRAKSKSILSAKSRGLHPTPNLPDPDEENFTIDQGEKDLKDVDQNKCIVDYAYNSLGAKYVKILKSQEPIRLVFSDKPFCTYQKVSARTLNRLRQQGIDFNRLQKDNPALYYNSFTRCYDPATMDYNGKRYCANHYRDLKFGRDIREDFNDQS